MDSVWQLTLVAALAAAASHWLRQARPQTRYALHCASLALMLALPVITLVALGDTALPSPAAAGAPQPGVSPAADRIGRFGESLAASGSSVLSWIPIVWLTGVTVLSVRWAVGWLYLRSQLRHHSSPIPPELTARIRNLGRALGIGSPIRAVHADWSASPGVSGWLRSIMLLPATVLGLPAQQLEAILAHELAHVRPHDYLVSLLQRTTETLLFFHPAVWWISRKITDERECCCDEVAATHCGGRLTYAKALLALEQSRQDGPQPALAATAGHLRRRIGRLLDAGAVAEARDPGWMAALAAAIVAGSLLFAAGTTAQQIPPGNWGPGGFAEARREYYNREYDRLARLGSHAKWLMEDVSTIIKPAEQAEFEALTSAGDRERFIQKFWAIRGEGFKAEHHRRLEYAHDLGWAAPGSRGFLRDRGFFYVLYGPPDEVEVHPNQWEAWRYRSGRPPDMIFDANGDITPNTNPLARK